MKKSERNKFRKKKEKEKEKEKYGKKTDTNPVNTPLDYCRTDMYLAAWFTFSLVPGGFNIFYCTVLVQ